MTSYTKRSAVPTGAVCPGCKKIAVRVKRTDPHPGGVRRRRRCGHCGHGFVTREIAIGADSGISAAELDEVKRITPTVVPPLVLLGHGDHVVREGR